MSFCIPYSDYLANLDIYDAASGPWAGGCQACGPTPTQLNSLGSHTYAGATIVLSRYFADSPIYAYSGTTGDSMQVPGGFNHAVYIDSSGNVTEEDVVPGQTLTFRSPIILGTAPTEVWVCTSDSRCVKVAGYIGNNGGFSSAGACLENCCASWCAGGAVACCNFGGRFYCSPTCGGVCCELNDNICTNDVCSPCPSERQINKPENDPLGSSLDCCPEGEVRCFAERVDDLSVKEKEVCCLEEKCCGLWGKYVCCKDTETCISDECCPQERICETTFDGTVCCPEGEVSVGGRCCPRGKEVCRGLCYDPCADGKIRNTSTCKCVPGVNGGFGQLDRASGGGAFYWRWLYGNNCPNEGVQAPTCLDPSYYPNPTWTRFWVPCGNDGVMYPAGGDSGYTIDWDTPVSFPVC